MDMGISFEKLKHPSQSPLFPFCLAEEPRQTYPARINPKVRCAGYAAIGAFGSNGRCQPEAAIDRKAYKFKTYQCDLAPPKDVIRKNDELNLCGF